MQSNVINLHDLIEDEVILDASIEEKPQKTNLYGDYVYNPKSDILFQIHRKTDKKTGTVEENFIPIYNGDLRIVENSVHLDNDTEMLLLSSTMNGKMATKLIGKDLLTSNKLAEELNKKKGFLVSRVNKNNVADYLFEQYLGMDRDNLLNETLYTKKMGWYENLSNGYDIETFVYPNCNADVNSLVTYDKEEKYNKVFTTKGTLDEWILNILEPSLQSDNIKTLILSTLASVLVKPLNVHENFIVDLSGTTGTGKTTATKVCASIFGHHRNYINDWNATSNSIISKAVELNCFPLMMDDTKKCTSKDMIPSIVYSISGGKSKGRSNIDGTLKQEQEFSNIMITTGEVPITEYLQGSETGRGAFARVITIEGGSFPKSDENKIIADKLNSDVGKYYGTFGIRFVSYILSNLDDNIDEWTEEFEAIKEKNSQLVTEELSKRKANHISLLEFTGRRLEELLGTDMFKLNDLIPKLLEGADTSSVQADNVKEAYDTLVEFINANRQRFYKISTVEGVNYIEDINNPLGQYKEDGSYFEFYEKKVVDQIISKFGDTKDLLRAFRERGYITTERERFTKRSRCTASKKFIHFTRINIID